jgi:hypothetical protein
MALIHIVVLCMDLHSCTETADIANISKYFTDVFVTECTVSGPE